MPRNNNSKLSNGRKNGDGDSGDNCALILALQE